MNAYGRAAALLPSLQQIYRQSQEVAAIIALYQSGADPHFNAAIESIFTPAERQQLLAMLTNTSQLVTAWTNNYLNLVENESN